MITLQFSLLDSKPFELSFDNTSTIKTAKEFLSFRFRTIPDNVSLSLGNSYFPDDLKLVDLGLRSSDVVQVMVTSSRTFIFLPPGKQPFDLPFRETATVRDAKVAISPKMKIAPERLSLLYDGQDLLDTLRLIDLNIPCDRFINIEVADDQIPTRKYTFMMQGEARELPFPDDATVADIKAQLAQLAEKGTESIELFVGGKPIKDDNANIGNLNIPRNDFIVVKTNQIRCKEIRDKNFNILPVVEARPDSPINEDDVVVEGYDEIQQRKRNKLSKGPLLQNMASQILQEGMEFKPPEREHDPPPDPTTDSL